MTYLECSKCGYVGEYEDTMNTLVLLNVKCGYCGKVDKGLTFKELDKAPKQLLKNIKWNMKAFLGIYKEVGQAIFAPERILQTIGYWMGLGIFMWKVIPVVVPFATQPEYVIDLHGFTELLIGLGGLCFAIYWLRKKEIF